MKTLVLRAKVLLSLTLLSMLPASFLSAQTSAITIDKTNYFRQTDEDVVTPLPQPFALNFHIRGGADDMTAWAPKFYIPGSGGVVQSGTSNATNTGTLNFSATPNNGTDFEFIHKFASAEELEAFYPSGFYGVKFAGGETFTAGLEFSTGTYPVNTPQIVSADNGATWAASSLVVRAAGITTLHLNSFSEFPSTTYGSYMTAGIYETATGHAAAGSAPEAYYLPTYDPVVNNPPVTQLTIDGDWLTPGVDYTLELQFHIFASPPQDGFLHSENFQGLASYKKITTIRIVSAPQAPTITSQPTAWAASAGGNATFSVTATGGGLNYQWRKNGVNLTESASVTGVNSRTLTITSTQAADAASYDVVINNSVGTIVSNAATLTISSAGNDFNHDGHPDLIWQNTATGQAALWLMHGTALDSGADLGTFDTAWKIVGSADFNHDGDPDLVWQNTTTGQAALWLMRGTTLDSGADLGTFDTAWKIAGIADFNHDGDPDLVWQNTTTGQAALWIMHGTALDSGADLGTFDTAWKIVGTADFNHDGNPDLVWQNTTTGQASLWLMHGTALDSGADLGTFDTSWTISGIADFNRDGDPDLIWQNTATGQAALWIMHGTALDSGADLGTYGLEWKIVN